MTQPPGEPHDPGSGGAPPPSWPAAEPATGRPQAAVPLLEWGGPAATQHHATPPPLIVPPPEPYPMRFQVEYSEPLSRWKTLLRLPLFVPIWLFFYLVQYFTGLAMAIGWTTVFWRRTYPRWLFEGLSGVLGYTARAGAYGLLLSDRYPSFGGEDSAVQLEYDEPPSGRLSRWRVLFWKLALLIPHFIVLAALGAAVLVVTVLAWFAVLFTGRYPRGLFGFVTGVMRWHFRVLGYFASFNDRFPPFALSAEAGPASRGATATCAVIGLLIGGLWAALIGVGIATAAGSDAETTDVDYAQLQTARADATTFYTGSRTNPSFVVALKGVDDPDSPLGRLLDVPDGQRLITFTWELTNRRGDAHQLAAGAATLEYRDDTGSHRVKGLVTVGGIPAPHAIEDGETATVNASFVLPDDAVPAELDLDPPWSALNGEIRYRFR